MRIAEQVTREIEYLASSSRVKIAAIGTTARSPLRFLVLPRRSSADFDSIGFLVSDEEEACYCMERLDGIADYVLVDVEAKQAFDLMAIASKQIRRAAVAAYKPNDATVEAADMLLRQHFRDDLSGRELLVLGAGNLSAKLALRLCERNAKVSLCSRNYKKTRVIAEGLNAMLPKFAPYRIEAVDQPGDRVETYDGLISFVAAEMVADERMAELMKAGALAVDGGINNFSPGFLAQSMRRGVLCTRLDVRLGFVYSMLSVGRDAKEFFKYIRGDRMFEGIRLVAGGIIGRRGDVIVDRINEPTQIIGIANGTGGVLSDSDYTEEDHRNLDIVSDGMSGKQVV